MKIGLIVGGLHPVRIGGAEKQALGLAISLSKSHEVTVFVRYNSRYNNEKFPFDLVQIKSPNVKFIRYFCTLSICMYQFFLRRNSLDVLFSYGLYDTGLKSMLASIIFDIPFISSIRAEIDYLKYSKLNNLIISKSHLIHVQSEIIKETFSKRFPESKVVVVPNGIFPSSIDFQKVSNRRKIIAYLGRLTENSERNDKGIRYLIKAMSGVKDSICIILGDGPARPTLEKMSRGKKIVFFGKIHPSLVAKYLSKVRCLVVPSVSGDGFPNVIIESMSVGTPVIATRSSGIPDIISDGFSGIFS